MTPEPAVASVGAGDKLVMTRSTTRPETLFAGKVAHAGTVAGSSESAPARNRDGTPWTNMNGLRGQSRPVSRSVGPVLSFARRTTVNQCLYQTEAW